MSEALTGGRGDTVTVGGQTKHVVGYMKDFLFSPEQARTPLRVLSGGERGRLMLARALAKPSNLLVLDEPTNDLDLETLDVLEEMLGGYGGTVILISHDRDFLDRVVNAVIVPEGDGRWIEYAGGYADMLAQRGADIARQTGSEAEGAAAAGQVHAGLADGEIREAQAELQREARARDAAAADRRARGEGRPVAPPSRRSGSLRARPAGIRRGNRRARGIGIGALGRGGEVARARDPARRDRDSPESPHAGARSEQASPARRGGRSSPVAKEACSR